MCFSLGLPLRESNRLLQAGGVNELHEGFAPPLIHRDLKPSNIVVSDGGLTIIDFGIARAFREGPVPTRPISARAPMRLPSSSAMGRPTCAVMSTPLGMLL